MAQFEQSSSVPAITMADLPAAGARWRRNPDGTWMRWSYLGEAWEPQTAVPALIQASQNNPSVDMWTVGQDGVWRPYDSDAKPLTPHIEEAKDSEQLPPPPPRADPEMVERPEWTSDWQPGWKQEFK